MNGGKLEASVRYAPPTIEEYDTAEEARKACEEKDQIAYFDLQMMESVDVDRNATSGQKEEVS